MNTGEIEAATVCLGQFVANFVRHDLPMIKRGTLPDACRAFKTLRDSYEKLDEFRKQINSAIEDMNRVVLPDMLKEAGTTTLRVECGGGQYFRFNRSQRVSCSITPEHKSEAFTWLRGTGNEGLIQETVNSSTLAGFAKDWVQNQGKDLPGEYFKISTMDVVSVTKA